MQPQHFRYHEDQGVAVLRLDRPERLNALTFDSYRELTDTFATLRTRTSVRAVLVTGTGRAFCTGGDQRDIIAPLLTATPAELNAFTHMTCELIANVRRLEKPVVAGLNGITCGAGAVLAAACDIRIAAESAKIAFLFTKVGLSGADMGAAWLLPRIVGMGHASEMLMSGDWVDARRAFEMGLYNRVVADTELASVAFEWARGLAAGPGMGLAVTKRMLNAEASMTFEQAMAAEGWVQAECMESPDYAEGYRAFIEKRAPDFAAAAAAAGAGAGAGAATTTTATAAAAAARARSKS